LGHVALTSSFVTYLLLVDDALRRNTLIACFVPMPMQHVLEGVDGLHLHHLGRQYVLLVKNSFSEVVLSQVYPYVGNVQFLRVTSCCLSSDHN